VLVDRGKKVGSAAGAAAPALALVIRAGAGIDNIDVAAASRLGIFVSNCPGKNSIAVAELILGLLLSLDRRIPDQVADLRRGDWRKGEYAKSRGLHGRTLGIVGLGQIGREVARRAQAFGMKIVAWSRNLTDQEADRLHIEYCQTPLEVARLSDAVSINVAGTAETRHLVNEEFLAAMKPGAYLINTSRGSVVDETALERAVRERASGPASTSARSEPSGSTGSSAGHRGSGWRVRDPSRRRFDRAGASRDRARGHPDRRRVRKHRLRAPLRQSSGQERGHPCAVGAASNRPGVLAHVFRCCTRVDQRGGGREHRLSRARPSARIHVASMPSEQALAEIRNGNGDVISVDLTAIE
jgi:D-3-phosphoglycerate dehydrogenase